MPLGHSSYEAMVDDMVWLNGLEGLGGWLYDCLLSWHACVAWGFARGSVLVT